MVQWPGLKHGIHHLWFLEVSTFGCFDCNEATSRWPCEIAVGSCPWNRATIKSRAAEKNQPASDLLSRILVTSDRFAKDFFNSKTRYFQSTRTATPKVLVTVNVRTTCTVGNLLCRMWWLLVNKMLETHIKVCGGSWCPLIVNRVHLNVTSCSCKQILWKFLQLSFYFMPRLHMLYARLVCPRQGLNIWVSHLFHINLVWLQLHIYFECSSCHANFSTWYPSLSILDRINCRSRLVSFSYGFA